VRAGSACGGGGGAGPPPCPRPPQTPKKDDRDQACVTVLPQGQCAGPPGVVIASCVRDFLCAGRFPAMGELAEEEERRRRGCTWSVVDGEARAGSAAGGGGGGGGGGPPHCPRPLPPSDKDNRDVVKGEADRDEARATMLPRGQCAGPLGTVIALCVRDVLGVGRFTAMGELAEEEECHQRGRTWSVEEGKARARVGSSHVASSMLSLPASQSL
jgi:hypothetical protein